MIFVKLRKFDSSLKNYIDKTKSFILKILISIFQMIENHFRKRNKH
jgi:hypothetical protein